MPRKGRLRSVFRGILVVFGMRLEPTGTNGPGQGSGKPRSNPQRRLGPERPNRQGPDQRQGSGLASGKGKATKGEAMIEYVWDFILQALALAFHCDGDAPHLFQHLLRIFLRFQALALV